MNETPEISVEHTDYPLQVVSMRQATIDENITSLYQTDPSFLTKFRSNFAVGDSIYCITFRDDLTSPARFFVAIAPERSGIVQNILGAQSLPRISVPAWSKVSSYKGAHKVLDKEIAFFQLDLHHVQENPDEEYLSQLPLDQILWRNVNGQNGE